MGCPASDLARVFCSCLSGKDRQEHWEELLEEFYNYLEEEIDDGRMPYSLEQVSYDVCCAKETTYNCPE
ncbi:unnamed protein product [Cylicostephanus goldi]|uniref:Uncharacterized protein n=1 Tax=Cylicostephanus goldi TaxID=71465 RepID=A0A3P7MAD7_CYLGO|nr:unnamed protein product [Cylicostephanus goldi]